jgi:hypothetical protein
MDVNAIESAWGSGVKRSADSLPSAHHNDIAVFVKRITAHELVIEIALSALSN